MSEAPQSVDFLEIKEDGSLSCDRGQLLISSTLNQEQRAALCSEVEKLSSISQKRMEDFEGFFGIDFLGGDPAARTELSGKLVALESQLEKLATKGTEAHEEMLARITKYITELDGAHAEDGTSEKYKLRVPTTGSGGKVARTVGAAAINPDYAVQLKRLQEEGMK